jgi:hypothetical protein
MVILRRFLVLLALFFWQGGFTFYAAVVVPVGQQVLHSHLRQGFITQQVTNYLNLSGAVALMPLAWEVAASRDPSTRRRWLQGLLWLLMLLALAALALLHGDLDRFLVARGRINLDPEAFRPRHRVYLWVSTVQWVFGLTYLLLTLYVWRAEDRQAETNVQDLTTGSLVGSFEERGGREGEERILRQRKG